MALRPIVENVIKTNPPSSIRVSNKMRKAADLTMKQKREEWMAARKKALFQGLTRSYGVAIYGSARLDDKSPEYVFVKDLARTLVSKRQINIVTGGGAGIMEAAHKGAKEAVEEAAKEGKLFKAHTLGINIELPWEQKPNEHIDIYTSHREFSTRLQEFVDRTQGVYLAPGGYGSLLELAMVMQLKQVGHLDHDYPIIVHPFWKPMFETLFRMMYTDRNASGAVTYISPEDLDELIEVSDDIEYISNKFVENYDKWHDEFKTREKKVSSLLKDLPVKSYAVSLPQKHSIH